MNFFAMIIEMGVPENANAKHMSSVASHRPAFPKSTDLMDAPSTIKTTRNGVKVVKALLRGREFIRIDVILHASMKTTHYNVTPRYVSHSVMPATRKRSIVLLPFNRRTSSTLKASPANPKDSIIGRKSKSKRKGSSST